MPTIELHGFESSKQTANLEKQIWNVVGKLDFADHVVLSKRHGSSVANSDGLPRPFIRLFSRSADRIHELTNVLLPLADVEAAVLHSFKEKNTAPMPQGFNETAVPFSSKAPPTETTDASFEEGLLTALEPIRQHVKAVVIHWLYQHGLFDLLKVKSMGLPTSEIAKLLEFEPYRVEGFLTYCRNEDLVSCSFDGRWVLTAQALALEPYFPWYTLLIGGYAKTFMSLGPCLKAGADYAERDVRQVSIGSCGMSQFDALPLSITLMSHSPKEHPLVLELGCGDGSLLADLLSKHPTARAVGFDPSKDAVEEGIRHAKSLGVSERLSLSARSAQDYLQGEDFVDADFIMFSFVLQEILQQDGKEAVILLLKKIKRLHPNASLVVIEVDNKWSDPDFMTSNKLALSYYNPYYLIHVLTEQKLETDAFWRSVFAESGWTVEALEYPPLNIDSTQLELGYLLSQ